MKKLIFILAILVASCNQNKKKEISPVEDTNLEAYEKIAMANGIKEFDSISQIKFTFNVELNDSIRSKRRWVWNTKSNRISLTEKDSTMSYTKKDSLAKTDQYIDSRFINDSYWLLFPYQLMWSNGELSEVKTATAPISEKEMKMMTVKYPSEGGYTPGDSYDIYFDDDYMIREWVYKSSDGTRESASTWENYKNFKGMKIATEHKSKDGNFRLFFTDISVEK